MIKFRNSKITKVIALALVLIFSSQQVGLATVTDLRDSADFWDYAVAIGAGYMAGQAIPANATASQLFITTYLMPEVAKQAVKAMGLKGTAALVANAFVSTLLVSSYNYGTSAIAETGSKASGVLGRASEMLGKMFKGAAFKGALADALTSAVIALVVSKVKKMFKGCKALGEAIAYWLAKQIGQRIRTALQKSFGVFLHYDPKRGPTSSQGEASKNEDGTTKYVRVYYYDESGRFTSKITTPEEANKILAGQNPDEYPGARQEDLGGERVYTVWTGSGYEHHTFKEAMDYQGQLFKAQSKYDNYRVAATVLLSLAGLKGEALILISAGAGAWMAGGSVKEGLMRGAISAVLSWMSTRTKSPLHGAVFALGASSILEYVVIGRDQLGREQQGQTGVDLVQGKKDYDLFRELVASAVTNANANFYSFGRAVPDVYGTAHGREYGFRWTSGNDVFFLTRYTDYAMDVQENGLGQAMMTQFINSYHSQAVNEFYKVVSGEIKNEFYVKRLREGYDQKLSDIYKRMMQKGEELLKGEAEMRASVLERLAQKGISDTGGEKGISDALQARIGELRQRIKESQDPAEQASLGKDLQELQQAGEILASLDKGRVGSESLQKARERQARREFLPATLLHIGVAFDPVLAGLGAATLLGQDGARKDMADYLARMEQVGEFLGGKEGEEYRDAARQMRRDLSSYDILVRERAVLQESGGWQLLPTIYGQHPYASIAPEVERNMQGRVARVGLSPDVERKRIEASPEYQANLQEQTQELTKLERERIDKEELPTIRHAIRDAKPGISEQELQKMVNEEVAKELNSSATQAKISQQAADRAYDLARAEVSADPGRGRLVGTAEYRDMVSGNPYYLDRWQPQPQPTPEKTVTPEPVKTPTIPSFPMPRIPSLPDTFPTPTPVVTLPPKSSPPNEARYRDVAEWSQLPADRTGATRTADDVYKVNMGIIPETLEQGRIAPQTYTDANEGIGYTTYGSNPEHRDLVVQAVPGDLGPTDTDYIGVYHKATPDDSYYKYIKSYPQSATDDSGQTIGPYRQYMDDIIGNYSRGGGMSGLSDPKAAIAFIQAQPPNIFQERLDKAGVDPATQEKMRRDLGVGHLPATQGRRDLTRYKIRENLDTDRLDTSRYEVWGNTGGEWKFERYAQPDEVEEFKYDIHSGSGTTASGAISAATGQTKPLSYTPPAGARTTAQEETLKRLETPASK